MCALVQLAVEILLRMLATKGATASPYLILLLYLSQTVFSAFLPAWLYLGFGLTRVVHSDFVRVDLAATPVPRHHVFAALAILLVAFSIAVHMTLMLLYLAGLFVEAHFTGDVSRFLSAIHPATYLAIKDPGSVAPGEYMLMALQHAVARCARTLALISVPAAIMGRFPNAVVGALFGMVFVVFHSFAMRILAALFRTSVTLRLLSSPAGWATFDPYAACLLTLELAFLALALGVARFEFIRLGKTP